MRTIRKILAMLLALAMCAGFLGVAALADDGAESPETEKTETENENENETEGDGDGAASFTVEITDAGGNVIGSAVTTLTVEEITDEDGEAAGSVTVETVETIVAEDMTDEGGAVVGSRTTETSETTTTVTETADGGETERVVSETTETESTVTTETTEIETGTETVETALSSYNTLIGANGTTVEGSLGETVVVKFGSGALEEPTVPEGYTEAGDGVYTKTGEDGVESSLEIRELRDENGLLYGYESIAAATAVTETETRMTEADLEGAVQNEDGTWSVTVTEVVDGVTVTTVRTVDPEKNVTRTKVTETVETVVTQELDADGTLTVTFGNAAAWTGNGALHTESILPDHALLSGGKAVTDILSAGSDLSKLTDEQLAAMTSDWSYLFHTAYYVKRAQRDAEGKYLKDENGNIIYDIIGSTSGDAGDIMCQQTGALSDIMAGHASRNEVRQVVMIDSGGNAHYMYCTDESVSYNPYGWFLYGMTNMDDIAYIDNDDDVKAISAIAENGYWGASDGAGGMEAFKTWLVGLGYEGDLDGLTPGIAEAVTQAAIWHYGASDSESRLASDGIDWTYRTSTSSSYSAMYNRSGESGWYTYKNGERVDLPASGGDKWTDEERAAVDAKLDLADALYKLIIGKGDSGELAESAAKSTDFLDKGDFGSVSVTVNRASKVDGTMYYNADLTFELDADAARLNFTGASGSGVYVKDSLGKWRYGTLSETEDGKTLVTISGMWLASGASATVQIRGTQEVAQAAYLVQYWTGNYEGTQSMVSVEKGTRDVWMGFTVKLDADARKATITTIEETTKTTVTETTEQMAETVAVSYAYPEPEPEPTPEPDPDPEPQPDPASEAAPASQPEPEPTPAIPVSGPVAELPDEPIPLAGPTETAAPPDESVPLTDASETVELPDEPVPLAGPDGTAELPGGDVPPAGPGATLGIPDEDAPLAATPRTGDDGNAALWLAVALVSLLGLGGLAAGKKYESRK